MIPESKLRCSGSFKPLSHGPLIWIKCGSNPDRIRISCVHMSGLIRFRMWVETSFGGGFDPHSRRIKDGGLSTRCLTDALVEHSLSQAAAKLVQGSTDRTSKC